MSRRKHKREPAAVKSELTGQYALRLDPVPEFSVADTPMLSAPTTSFSDYIVYVDESGDHGLMSVDENYPVFVLSLLRFPQAALCAAGCAGS